MVLVLVLIMIIATMVIIDSMPVVSIKKVKKDQSKSFSCELVVAKIQLHQGISNAAGIFIGLFRLEFIYEHSNQIVVH